MEFTPAALFDLDLLHVKDASGRSVCKLCGTPRVPALDPHTDRCPANLFEDGVLKLRMDYDYRNDNGNWVERKSEGSTAKELVDHILDNKGSDELRYDLLTLTAHVQDLPNQWGGEAPDTVLRAEIAAEEQRRLEAHKSHREQLYAKSRQDQYKRELAALKATREDFSAVGYKKKVAALNASFADVVGVTK